MSNNATVNFPFPSKGYDSRRAYADLEPLTTPACLNVRAHSGPLGRATGGARPALTPAYDAVLAGPGEGFEMRADVSYLRKRWQQILDASRELPAPSLLYQELSLGERQLVLVALAGWVVFFLFYRHVADIDPDEESKDADPGESTPLSSSSSPSSSSLPASGTTSGNTRDHTATTPSPAVATGGDPAPVTTGMWPLKGAQWRPTVPHFSGPIPRLRPRDDRAGHASDTPPRTDGGDDDTEDGR